MELDSLLLKMARMRKQLLQGGQVSAFIDSCQVLLNQLASEEQDPRRHAMLKYMLVREIILQLVRLNQWKEAYDLFMKHHDELVFLPPVTWKRRILRMHHSEQEPRLLKASKLKCQASLDSFSE